MDIAFHIGANCTDEERLLKSLLKNSKALNEQGIVAPLPNKYRRLLRETMHACVSAPPKPDTRDILLDAILEENDGRRVVLSNPDFLCVPNRIFENGQFYSTAIEKVSILRQLFPEDRIQFFLAIRNPATFIPAVYGASKQSDLVKFMNGRDPETIRWAEVIERMQSVAADVDITVWCNEDTPLLWAHLIREISGVDPMTRISGGFDLLQEVMTLDGMKRFLAYIRAHPPQTEARKRRIISTFLDKFANEDAIYDEFELDGWDQALVDRITQHYEADVAKIKSMPGIRFLDI